LAATFIAKVFSVRSGEDLETLLADELDKRCCNEETIGWSLEKNKYS
jgi:hypothetical protein